MTELEVHQSRTAKALTTQIPGFGIGNRMVRKILSESLPLRPVSSYYRCASRSQTHTWEKGNA
jgi:hypothetical protein